jgi:hypothetical protein
MSKKSTHFYSFNSSAGQVSIDLNNYTVKCSKTGHIKKFYHKYLANMIQTRFNNCISTFEDTYVSREAGPDKNARKVQALQARIDRHFKQINILKGEVAEIKSGTITFPAA